MRKRTEESYEEIKAESLRRAEQVVTGCPTRADFERVVSDCLIWKVKNTLREVE